MIFGEPAVVLLKKNPLNMNKNDKLEACTDHRQLDAFFRLCNQNDLSWFLGTNNPQNICPVNLTCLHCKTVINTACNERKQQDLQKMTLKR